MNIRSGKIGIKTIELYELSDADFASYTERIDWMTLSIRKGHGIIWTRELSWFMNGYDHLKDKNDNSFGLLPWGWMELKQFLNDGLSYSEEMSEQRCNNARLDYFYNLAVTFPDCAVALVSPTSQPNVFNLGNDVWVLVASNNLMKYLQDRCKEIRVLKIIYGENHITEYSWRTFIPATVPKLNIERIADDISELVWLVNLTRNVLRLVLEENGHDTNLLQPFPENEFVHFSRLINDYEKIDELLLDAEHKDKYPKDLIPWIEERLRRIIMFEGIGNGMGALHSHRILHGDLHFGNIMVSEDRVPKIIDFGNSMFPLRELKPYECAADLCWLYHNIGNVERQYLYLGYCDSNDQQAKEVFRLLETSSAGY
jgi:hypothetical protein